MLEADPPAAVPKATHVNSPQQPPMLCPPPSLALPPPFPASLCVVVGTTRCCAGALPLCTIDPRFNTGLRILTLVAPSPWTRPDLLFIPAMYNFQKALHTSPSFQQTTSHSFKATTGSPPKTTGPQQKQQIRKRIGWTFDNSQPPKRQTNLKSVATMRIHASPDYLAPTSCHLDIPKICHIRLSPDDSNQIAKVGWYHRWGHGLSMRADGERALTSVRSDGSWGSTQVVESRGECGVPGNTKDTSGQCHKRRDSSEGKASWLQFGPGSACLLISSTSGSRRMVKHIHSDMHQTKAQSFLSYPDDDVLEQISGWFLPVPPSFKKSFYQTLGNTRRSLLTVSQLLLRQSTFFLTPIVPCLGLLPPLPVASIGRNPAPAGIPREMLAVAVTEQCNETQVALGSRTKRSLVDSQVREELGSSEVSRAGSSRSLHRTAFQTVAPDPSNGPNRLLLFATE
ncbi:hypothetical protein BDK51DRAFT_44910 [Blyttiomyces helicus]|uniref:Uncharacterized protein n=1 Tax=Blyttiomyces helicus TaxID=388810 RepID=A0A4P9WI93_9FUNG|nr:hypothetical protein BDK51DRAFT_44910 [Blyttiomyces helicus]|eukprot:RKO91715.1 hypothetical protein BDK51DRAFT_44910 [Blyttiomyces helicus]